MASEATLDVGRVFVRFARELRAAGLGVSGLQLAAFMRSFTWIDPGSRADVYNAARTTLLSRREDLELFDRVFAGFWCNAAGVTRPSQVPLAPRQRREARPALAMLMNERARAGDPAVDLRDRSLSASEDELLKRKDFASMTPLELLSVRRLIEQGRWGFATRVTRRRVGRKSGPELDLRRVPSLAARAGGVVLTLPRRAPKVKQRPLVILADISGSMELYARVLLQLMHALRQRLSVVETFVFATRLTRITNELAVSNMDHALDQVAGSVVDFASGTRIAGSLHCFNTAWAGRVLSRGAVVLIMSDGWERGRPESLEKEMRILRERCFRLIWLNPRLGHAGYEPKVLGMAAALGYVDDFLACHDMQSLETLARHLGALPRRRGARASNVRPRFKQVRLPGGAEGAS